MPDEKKWLCCGCGEPVDDDGFPTCKCPTDVLYKRGTNEHAIKPRPCATCGPRRETSFPKPSTMPDDAIERARECLAATPHDPHENCGRLNVVFARCTCDRHLRAMLAFASQQAPEGWRPIETAPKDGTPFDVWMPNDFGGYRVTNLRFNAGKLCSGNVPCGNLSRWPTHWRPLPAPPAMLDAAPSVTLGEVG